MNVQLIVNERKFPVHYQLLLALAENMPDSAQYRELARALLALGVPSITKSLLKSAASLLDQEDLDTLWATGNLDIRRSLAARPEFVKCLTDAQVKDILKTRDPEILSYLAGMAKLLYSTDTKEHGGRLSAGTIQRLLDEYAIGRIEYAKVYQTLVENADTPIRYRPAFREAVECGVSEEQALPTIRPQDVEILTTASVETLQRIACNADKIKNREALEVVVKMLRSHPDPFVRLALARNSRIPRPFLVPLRDDPEPDVSLAARETLGLKDDGEGHAMSRVHLVIDGENFPVHYLPLLSTVANLPDGVEHYGKLAKALIGLGVPSIARSLLQSSVSWMDKEDVDEFWASGDLEIRRSLVANPDFVRQLTDAQAQDILDDDDPKMLESLAGMATLLYTALKGEIALSFRMAADLLERIETNPCSKVRRALARACYVPQSLRPTVRQCMEANLDVTEVFSDIQPEEVDLLHRMPVETLKYIADRVDDIEDEKAQEGVIDLLCSHYNSSVRLALARNSLAPQSALERLARDADLNINQAARESLGEMGFLLPVDGGED